MKNGDPKSGINQKNKEEFEAEMDSIIIEESIQKETKEIMTKAAKLLAPIKREAYAFEMAKGLLRTDIPWKDIPEEAARLTDALLKALK